VEAIAACTDSESRTDSSGTKTDLFVTGTSSIRSIAAWAAMRSGPSSCSVEETKTRSRWSGVRIAAFVT
jgi:hypothetical protein